MNQWNEQVMQEQHAEIWGAVIGAVVGGGLALYGSNKQSKDNAHAQDVNIASQEKQNDSGWSNYLFSRGIAPTTPVQPGVLPQEGQYKTVNTRLPLWMTMKSPPQAAAKRGGFLIQRAA